MKKQFYITLTLLLALLCNSCIDETFVQEEHAKGDKLHLRITAINPEEIYTRATTNDNAIQNVYVLIFNGNKETSLLKGIVKATSSDALNYYASLEYKDEGGYMYVIANAANKIVELQSSWKVDETQLSTLKSELILSLSKDGDYISSDEVAAASPMMKEIAYTGSGNKYEVELTRSVAKISVIDNSKNTRYKLQGVNAGNAPVSGYVFSGMSSETIEKANYAGLGTNGTYSPDNMMKGMEEVDPATPLANPTTKPLYLFESKADPSKVDEGTFVIIKGEYNGVVGYHKLNIWKDNNTTTPVTKEFLDIQRNFHYKILINKVYTTGYRTAREAISNAAANINDVDYGIDITDGVSLDIVTNGTYYLGLSNTEYLLYDSKETTDLLIASIATNAKEGVAKGTIEMNVTEGTGDLTYKSDFSTITYDGDVHTSQIIANIPATVLKAEFILRVGDLAQTIRFERISNSLAFGGSMELPQGYAYAKMLNANTSIGEAWASFTVNELDNVKNGTQEFFNGSGENSTLYLAYDNNLIFTTAPSSRASTPDERTADALLFKAHDGGHTRMHLVQTTFDIFNKDEVADGKIANPYVGAFWRYSQTGERVIKMTATASQSVFLPRLTWTATVVVGQSWTRLQNGGSKDGSIYTSTPTLGNDSGFESSHQLDADSAKTVISGNGENVIFRIGLTKTINPDEHRYGLIIVATYLDNKPQNTYRIFTRQGEAPDYLFRKEDPTATPEKWPIKDGKIRPKTVKLSPFNLTDPNAGIGGTGNYSTFNAMPMDYNKTLGSHQTFDKRKFTEYPSQAGYFFIWNAHKQDLKNIKGEQNQWIRAIHPLLCSGVRPGKAYEFTIPNPPPFNTYAENYSGDGDGNLPMYGFGTDGGNPVNWTQISRTYVQDSDPCPYGYRTSHLSDEWNDDGDALYIKEDAQYSELLQSLFYEPFIIEGTNSMHQYTLWGYYADGFYDRLQITARQSYIIPKINKSFPIYNFVCHAEKITECTGNDIGYIGGVTFNPFNFASIFSPAVGSYDMKVLGVVYGYPLNAGQSYLYWTANRVNTVKDGTSIPLYLSASVGTFNFENAQGADYFGKSIRCVRDESIVKNVTPAEYN